MANGFGLNERETEEEYREYIGKYVEIKPLTGHERFYGRLIRIEGGNAVLNPHYSQGYSELGARYVLLTKNQKVSLMVPFSIRPTTKKDLENLCELATENSIIETRKMRENPKEQDNSLQSQE